MSAQPPLFFDTPAAWLGKDMAQHPERWLYTLSNSDITDLEEATAHWESLGKPITEINAAAFPLKRFNSHLAELSHKLIGGPGVEVLRGLPVNRYDAPFVEALFCGIGTHLGNARVQNAQGDLLGHVRDVGVSSADPTARIYQTAERQTFHTDSADVVGLCCLHSAMEGGRSLLVSTLSIYNEMQRRQPDLLPFLFEPIATDRRGEIPNGAKPYFEIPVLNWHAGQLTGMYQRQYIDSAQRFPDAPRLTSSHIEALNLFDELANDPDLYFGMDLQAGDMQFVYNHALLHDRTGFTDWPEADRQRQLHRRRPSRRCLYLMRRDNSLHGGKKLRHFVLGIVVTHRYSDAGC